MSNVDVDYVRGAAAFTKLPLPEVEVLAVAVLLANWQPGQVALSVFMGREEWVDVTPIEIRQANWSIGDEDAY
jgi:hypothetical protein